MPNNTGQQDPFRIAGARAFMRLARVFALAAAFCGCRPGSAPKEVTYGLESSDEMAVLSAQLLPRSPAAADRLTQTLMEDVGRWMLEYNSFLVQRQPRNAEARVGLGRALYNAGQLDPAAQQIAVARQLDPLNEDAAFLSGMVFQFRKQPFDARAPFEDCLRLNPNNVRAHGCFGVLAVEQGWLDVAELHFREVLRLDPADTTARDALRQLKGIR